jgi:hypothetical protein
MSVPELKRVHVIRHAMGNAPRQQETSEVLGLTTRQVRGLNTGSGPKATRGSCIGAGQALKPADPRKGKFQDRCHVSELAGELIPAHSP